MSKKDELDKALDELTTKQRAFVVNYIEMRNGKDAAIAAGYSPNSAYVIASQNLRKPKIQHALKLIWEAEAMTAEEVLHGLAGIARNGENENARNKAYELIGKYVRGCLWTDNVKQDTEIKVRIVRD